MCRRSKIEYTVCIECGFSGVPPSVRIFSDKLKSNEKGKDEVVEDGRGSVTQSKAMNPLKKLLGNACEQETGIDIIRCVVM